MKYDNINIIKTGVYSNFRYHKQLKIKNKRLNFCTSLKLLPCANALKWSIKLILDFSKSFAHRYIFYPAFLYFPSARTETGTKKASSLPSLVWKRPPPRGRSLKCARGIKKFFIFFDSVLLRNSLNNKTRGIWICVSDDRAEQYPVFCA